MTSGPPKYHGFNPLLVYELKRYSPSFTVFILISFVNLIYLQKINAPGNANERILAKISN